MLSGILIEEFKEVNTEVEGRKQLEGILKSLGIDYAYYNKKDNSESNFLVVADYPYNESYEHI